MEFARTVRPHAELVVLPPEVVLPLRGHPAAAGGKVPAGNADAAAGDLASGIMQAQQPMTGYGEALAKRSSPDMSRK